MMESAPTAVAAHSKNAWTVRRSDSSFLGAHHMEDRRLGHLTATAQNHHVTVVPAHRTGRHSSAGDGSRGGPYTSSRRTAVGAAVTTTGRRRLRWRTDASPH